MAGDSPRIDVVAAARRIADREVDRLAFVELLDRLRKGLGTRPDERAGDSGHGGAPDEWHGVFLPCRLSFRVYCTGPIPQYFSGPVDRTHGGALTRCYRRIWLSKDLMEIHADGKQEIPSHPYRRGVAPPAHSRTIRHPARPWHRSAGKLRAEL